MLRSIMPMKHSQILTPEPLIALKVDGDDEDRETNGVCCRVKQNDRSISEELGKSLETREDF